MTPDPAPYVRDLSWRYPQKIEPRRTPHPWKRVGFALVFVTAAIPLAIVWGLIVTVLIAGVGIVP